jgi:hypothetical protein
MKKAFGVIFLLLGLAMIGLGIAALTNLSTRNSSYEGEVRNQFSDSYRSASNGQAVAGLGLVGGGVVFFILGIVMVVSKSKSQRIKDAELKFLKTMHANDLPPQLTTKENKNSFNDAVFAQLEKLGKLKEKGLITDEEFQEQKKKLLQ